MGTYFAMITHRTYEQLTPVCDNVCTGVRNIITKCVPIIYRILQYGELSLEKAPFLFEVIIDSVE